MFAVITDAGERYEYEDGNEALTFRARLLLAGIGSTLELDGRRMAQSYPAGYNDHNEIVMSDPSA